MSCQRPKPAKARTRPQAQLTPLAPQPAATPLPVASESTGPGAPDPIAAAQPPGADERPDPSRGTTSTAVDRIRAGVLVGVGFPRPLAVEALVKPTARIALGAELSFAPTMTIFGAETTFWGVAGDARLFPFKGPFFVGFRGGWQRLTMTTQVLLPNETVDARATAETAFVNPRIGVLWTSASGITLGADLGVHVPIEPRFASNVPDAVMGTRGETLASTARVLGNGVTPTVDLLRVGVLF